MPRSRTGWTGNDNTSNGGESNALLKHFSSVFITEEHYGPLPSVHQHNVPILDTVVITEGYVLKKLEN